MRQINFHTKEDKAAAIGKDELKPWQRKLHTVIYEADTFGGKFFDIALLIAILISIVAVMLESVPSIRKDHEELLVNIELTLTILFSIEYILRIISIKKPLKYVLSFYGIVDLLSILPTYLGMFGNYKELSVIRGLRLIRIFRIFKLGRFLRQGSEIASALRSSRPKIVVFSLTVLMICIIMGTIMYLVESPEAGFTSIPRSIYWAIVTLTTVGYGDISPLTALGQGIASIIMLLGYAIIAVPTGIVTAELSKSDKDQLTTQSCSNCLKEGHAKDAIHCKYCGEKL